MLVPFRKLIKLQRQVRISLALAICLVFVFLQATNANDVQTDLTKQIATVLPECQGSTCFGKPNDLAITNDSSSIVVVDSSQTENPGTFLKIIPVTSDGQIGEIKNIQLNNKPPGLNLATLSLSKNSDKAIVFKDSLQGEESSLQLVDIKNNNVKDLKLDIPNTILIQVPFFIGSDEILAGIISPTSSELVTLDTETNQVTNEFVLPDTIQSLHVCPTLKHAIVTYSDFLAQSVSLYDITKDEQTQLSIASSLATSVEDISTKVDFDLLGKRAVLSSIGGYHVLHLVDIENKKLISRILDKTEGPTIGTISSDGKTCIVIGSVLDTFTGFKAYKVNVTDEGKVSVLNTASFGDGSIALDVKVTPDQSRVLVLFLKDNQKQLLVLSMKDLSKVATLVLSQDTTQSSLHVSSNGLLAVTNNVNEETISIVKNLSQGGITLIPRDTFPPEITVTAPKDSAILNTKRVLVFGKVDGTGSSVKSVTVQGKEALLNAEGIVSKNTVNFVSDVQLEGEGTVEVLVKAIDEANNEATKVIKIKTDTQIPALQANVEVLAANNFNVSGKANGTGSNISSVTVNSQPVQFTPGEDISFSATTNLLPIVIVATDEAGNKKQFQIGDPATLDNNPPVISVISPSGGEIFKETKQVNVTFTVTDDIGVKEVVLNGSVVTSSGQNQYSSTVNLKPGQNLISLAASDTANNIAKINIVVTFLPKEISEIAGTKVETPTGEEIQEKEIITLSPEAENLNEAIIQEFSKLVTEEGEPVDLSSTVSVEISNPPPIPEGTVANIEVPEVEGLQPSEEGQPLEIPKGFSFASDIVFEEEPSSTPVSAEEQDTQSPAVLVDSLGRTFVVGFAFRREEDTSSGLVTTFTVPSDAAEGDARITVLGENESIATIPLVIAPESKVRAGKKIVEKPQIKEPIIASVNKNTNKLRLIIKGKDFIGKVAVIDGELEKLTAKAEFFTNVTFVPDEGIKIKNLKLLKNKIILNAEISADIKPGIKLFNVITPRGADIGAIIFPDPITAGSLETTINPESLILEEAE